MSILEQQLTAREFFHLLDDYRLAHPESVLTKETIVECCQIYCRRTGRNMPESPYDTWYGEVKGAGSG